jgi:hypothetical protein
VPPLKLSGRDSKADVVKKQASFKKVEDSQSSVDSEVGNSNHTGHDEELDAS